MELPSRGYRSAHSRTQAIVNPERRTSVVSLGKKGKLFGFFSQYCVSNSSDIADIEVVLVGWWWRLEDITVSEII